MITAFILEDEPNARELLKLFINSYCPEVRLVGEAADAAQAYEHILREKPELLLFDIEIGHEGSPETSFDLLARLPEYPYEVIFTTAFDHYALQAIKHHALDYLLKPIHIEELKNAVQRAHSRIMEGKSNHQLRDFIQNMQAAQSNNRERIWLQTTGGIQAVSIRDIVRLEISEGLTQVHTTDMKRRSTAQPLRELVELLDKLDFFPVHRSHCVNLHHVTKVLDTDGGELVMSDESRIPIARRRKQELLEVLKKI